MSDKDRQRRVEEAERRADVADEYTHTAHSIAARLDRLNHNLTIQNGSAIEEMRRLNQEAAQIANYATTHERWNGA